MAKLNHRDTEAQRERAKKQIKDKTSLSQQCSLCVSVFLWLIGSFGIPLMAAGNPVEPPLLRPGRRLTVRVRQVLPADALSPGERVLNGRAPLAAGDRFLAEVVAGPEPSHVLLGGTVVRVHPPGWFRQPGHVEVQIAQLVDAPEGSSGPTAWHVDLDDRRLSGRLRRTLATVLFGLEGFGVGASIGAQFAQGNMAYIGGGGGIGLVTGLGIAAVQRGPAGDLQPGDTFEVEVGTCSYRPLPLETQMEIYPAKVPVRK
jgi:hypothetical protein